MKAIKKNLKETSKYGLILLVIIVIFIFLLSKFFSTKIKKNILDAIDGFSNNYIELNYDDVKVSVNPAIIKIKIVKPKILVDVNGKKMEFNMEEILVKNTTFTKNFNVFLPNKIELIAIGGDKNEIILEGNAMEFKLNKDYSLNNFDSFAQKLAIENVENSDVVVSLENLAIRIINITSEDYKNKTFRINIDKIIKKNLRKNIEAESNFELVVSNMKEVDAEKDIVAITNLIDTFTFNDITNNYAFRINGNYNADKSTKNLGVDIELEVANYNSLISALNNKEDDYFLNKSQINEFIQILELIPDNKKNTESNKYYKIVGDLINKSLFLNDEDVNVLIRKLLYRNSF